MVLSLTSLANTTITVARPTKTADAYGGQSLSYSTVYSGLSVSLQPASGDTVEQFAKRSMIVTHRAYTATPVSIRAGDKVTDADGRVYSVSFFENQAGRNRVYAIWLQSKDQA